MPHTTIRLFPSFYQHEEAQPEQLSPLLSPVRLSAVAHLYGVETASLSQARVLEIDCGIGNNLLPFALAYPQSTVIGISLDATDCLAGQMLAQSMGATNLHLYALSLDQVTPEVGEFDYIIIRKLYGQLAEKEAATLLQTCEALLGPSGIVCIGYDTYPGAKMVEVVRDAMLMHTYNSTEPEQLAAQAEAALALFNEGLAQTNPQAQILTACAKKMAEQLRNEGVAAVLGNPSTPRYFIEFAGQAAQAGLDYMGDSDALSDLPERWGGNVQLVNAVMGMGQAGAVRLQYLDLATGRNSRYSLLTSAKRGVGARYQPELARLVDLRWAAGWQRKSWGLADDDGRAVFVNHQQREWVAPNEVSAAVLDILALAWPGSVSFSSLVQGVRKIVTGNEEEPADKETDIRTALLQMMQVNIVHCCLGDGPYDNSANKEPVLLSSLELLAKQKVVKDNEGNPTRCERSWFPFNLWNELLTDEFHVSDWARLIKQGNSGDLLNRFSNGFLTQTFDAAISTGEVWKVSNKQNMALAYELWLKGGFLANASCWRDALSNALKESDGIIPFWGLYLASIERYALQENEDENVSEWMPGLIPQEKAQIERAKQLLAQLNYDEVEVHAQQLIRRLPDLPVGYGMLARCLVNKGRNQDAFKIFSKLTSKGRWQVDCVIDLVMLLINQGLQDEALRVGRVSLCLDPNNARMHNILGLLCMRSLKLKEAEKYFSHAIQLDSNILPARVNLLSVFSRQGKVREGVDAAHNALNDKDHAKNKNYRSVLYHNLLFLSNYDPDRSAEEIFKDYKNFEDELCRPLYEEWKRHRNNKSIRRKLRVGYISPDYRNHAVAKFLGPVFELHDKNKFEIVAYSDVKTEDEVTVKFKNMADYWRPILGQSDRAVAELIRKDEIDVLIDLAGHTGDNRLGVFARKPAPVSATWLGYGYTTGVSAIDYFIGDKYLCPPGYEHLFAEKTWCLPNSFVVYRANWEEMEKFRSESSPARKNGFVTFSLLSRSIRINHRVLKVWAEILNRITDSRLVINSESYADSAVCEELRRNLESLGVQRDRVLLGYSSPPWKTLGETDIGLDCFPHNSGTTLIDMLCMGVPYVTLADRPSVGRMGQALLNAVEMPELVTYSEEEYVNKIINLSRNIDYLEGVRRKLIRTVPYSALVDEKGFVHDLESAYQSMFEIWISSQ